MKSLNVVLTWAAALAVIGAVVLPSARAADRSQLDAEARAALSHLVSSNAGAKAISAKAHAVLVFPSITKAGLMIGAQSGDGVLMKSGKSVA